MFTQAITVVLDDPSLDTERWIPLPDVARICCLSSDWLIERIEDQVLEATTIEGCYHLSPTSIPRIQHMVDIERQYDADPHLAALMADLMEEVRALRRQLAFHRRSGP